MRCRRRTYLAIYTDLSCLIHILIFSVLFKRAMERGAGAAFCPAHVTGFFKAEAGGGAAGEDGSGSLGAGFSIARGVRTRVSGARIEEGAAAGAAGEGGGEGVSISTAGYAPGDTAVSREVAAEFERAVGAEGGGGARLSADIRHEIGVPVGYGLGCSSAAALSLALALNEALGCGMPAEQAGRIAHRAEIRCRTGLGDVLAAYHGGFEVRVRAGAPGVGRVARAGGRCGASGGRCGNSGEGTAAVIGCFSPVSTRRFITERLSGINGLGGVMVERMAGAGGDLGMFQDMSMEFALHIGVVTPRMAAAAAGLRGAGIGCGVALFGETVFALPSGEAEEERAAGILAGSGCCETIRTEIGGPARVEPRAGEEAGCA